MSGEGPARARLARLVREAVAEVLGTEPEDVPESADLAGDFGVDSLELMDIGARLETALGLRVPVEDLTSAATVGEAVDLLLARLGRPE